MWLRPPGPVAPGLRIGLLGGSFNPAHAGHLYVAEIARRRLALDYVWWIVSPQNPLKPVEGMLPFEARYAAARALAAGNPRIVVTELERTLGSSYTLDTIKALRRRFAQVRFVWLMGSDNLEQFHRWRGWREIARRLPVAVVLRPGSTLAPLRARAAKTVHVLVIDGRRNETSATAIRGGIGAAKAGMLH
ncbi:MAG: nicotinate (nicotinamide) nucleotide adenylyltransferase [Alphaproteobacteria bacterium]|nr:nicotinate (nicotinamide) nucleotide adenylyltransferase [Alphaproteobacteria bacterium]MDE2495745.1 nicotinate (nicotinamide) nucleotide adenylyltransferase [Alphaproteobacteria bacterium]